MSGQNEEISIARKVAAGETTRRELKIAENRADLGVCLIAKCLHGTYRAVFSGCVAKTRSLFPNWKRKFCIITSGKIDVKQYYLLYFKKLNSRVKRVKLESVTSSKGNVEYISGLAFIPLNDTKLRKGIFYKSSILTYRPFTVSKEESIHGSVCHIVDGHPEVFTVTAYDVECVDGKYFLKLPEKDAIFKTFSELTAQGSNNLQPYGAVILKSIDNMLMAVGVLDFVDDKLSPVLFSQLPGIGRQYTTPPVTTGGATPSLSEGRPEEPRDLSGAVSDQQTSLLHADQNRETTQDTNPSVTTGGTTPSLHEKRPEEPRDLSGAVSDQQLHFYMLIKKEKQSKTQIDLRVTTDGTTPSLHERRPEEPGDLSGAVSDQLTSLLHADQNRETTQDTHSSVTTGGSTPSLSDGRPEEPRDLSGAVNDQQTSLLHPGQKRKKRQDKHPSVSTGGVKLSESEGREKLGDVLDEMDEREHSALSSLKKGSISDRECEIQPQRDRHLEDHKGDTKDQLKVHNQKFAEVKDICPSSGFDEEIKRTIKGNELQEMSCFIDLSEAVKQQDSKDLKELQVKMRKVISKARDTAVSHRAAADTLDAVWENCKKAHATGTVSGMVGGFFTIAGGIATITTMGAVTPLLFAGMAAGAAGAGINVVTSVVETAINSSEIKKAEKDRQETLDCVEDVNKIVES